VILIAFLILVCRQWLQVASPQNLYSFFFVSFEPGGSEVSETLCSVGRISHWFFKGFRAGFVGCGLKAPLLQILTLHVDTSTVVLTAASVCTVQGAVAAASGY
jgi:hypothetical protein